MNIRDATFWRAALWRGGVGAVFALVLLPMVAVVWLSFFRQEIASFPPDGYSLRWYANAWDKKQFINGFANSLELALIAASIGVTVGTAAAVGLVRGNFPGRGFLSGLLLGPLAVPGVVLGTGLYVFFVQIDNAIDFQIVATLPGLIAAHVLLTIPWTVRLVSASLMGVTRSVEEAAANLGARPFTVFRRVVFPLALPGVIAGSALVFILCMNAYATPILLGGAQFKMMAPAVYDQFVRTTNWPFGAALAFILLFVTLGLTMAGSALLARRYRA